MGWLSIATPYPVEYKTQQMGMQAVWGAVLHTTNHTAGAETVARFQQDWKAKQAQSAHFVIDRLGQIGQCRMLSQVAWHISASSPHYIGIEHISRPDVPITREQIEASGTLLSSLSDTLGFPLVPFTKGGAVGVGMHVAFYATRCGRNVFWQGSDKGGGQFGEILDFARSYSTLGY